MRINKRHADLLHFLGLEEDAESAGFWEPYLTRMDDTGPVAGPIDYAQQIPEFPENRGWVFLRLCQMVDSGKWGWDNESVKKAARG